MNLLLVLKTDAFIFTSNFVSQGYVNSGIYARAFKHSLEKVTLSEIQNAVTFINAFRNMKSSVNELR